MLKSNITKEWSRILLHGFEFSVTSKDGTNCIKYKEGGIKRKVIINEEDCWYVIISYVPLSSIEVFNRINSSDLEKFCILLNEQAMIGFYVISEEGSTDRGNYKKNFMYKTHQRFIRNDDTFNIERTIKLLTKDHELHFQSLLDCLDNRQEIENLQKIQNFQDIDYNGYLNRKCIEHFNKSG